MAKIEEIDQNFKETQVETHDDVIFYSCLQEPFQIYGLLLPESAGSSFLRIPARVAEGINQDVAALNHNTAGGRVRFRTNSPYIAIRAKLDFINRASHIALTGSAGLDLYYDEGKGMIYAGTFIPPYDLNSTFNSLLELDSVSEREIMINLPLYSGVQSLEIGLQSGSTVNIGREYQYKTPVVYYGSSITQGGCASRPGNAYQSILSRKLDCDYINLGFSGSAKGEDLMADYIAGLPMSVFVYDYDHNAPEVRHLSNTHERMFLRIREQNPELPVIMVSRPKVRLSEAEKQRLEIIETTFQNALKRGDHHVYFIDGSKLLLKFGGDGGTVDNCHPNDLGFMCMAEGIGAVLKEALLTA